MFGILIGILVSIGFVIFLNFKKSENISLKWWNWIIVIAWFLYDVFLLKMIESFILENALKAALVMGLFFGFIALIWAILVFRFMLKPKIQTS